MIGSAIAQRLLRILPGQEAVTLYSRQAGETGFTGVTYQAQRKPATRGELFLAGAVLGQTWHTFELVKISQTVEPKLLDAILDAASVRHEIKKVDVKMGGYVFKCLCLQDVQ